MTAGDSAIIGSGADLFGPGLIDAGVQSVSSDVMAAVCTQVPQGSPVPLRRRGPARLTTRATAMGRV